MFKLLKKFWVGELSDAINDKKTAVKLPINDQAIETANFGIIVVCGEESSGKSNSLRRLLQEEIFEVGEEIITRAPLRITLTYMPTESKKKMVLTIPSKPILTTYNAHEIHDAIKAHHDSIQASGIGISEIESTLNVYSNSVPNVTIIDLPGLLVYAGDGEPNTLPTTVRNIVKKYIELDDCIVLNVIDATANQRSSIGAALLREVAPEKIIKVFTKVDLLRDERQAAGPLTSFLEKFNKEEKLGYTCVALSNYKADESDTFDQITRAETEFFESNLDYNKYKDKVGIEVLLRHINRLAEESTREEWAQLQKESEEKNLLQLETQLKSQGPELTMEQLIYESIYGLLHDDSKWELLITKAWNQCAFPLPTNDLWIFAHEFDIKQFLLMFKVQVAAKLKQLFEFNSNRLHRYSKFYEEFVFKFNNFIDSKQEMFLIRWSKLSKHIWKLHDTSDDYKPAQWLRAVKCCLISEVFMPEDLKSQLEFMMQGLSIEENAKAIAMRESLVSQIKAIKDILQMLPATNFD